MSHTMAVRPEPLSCYWPLGISIQNVGKTFLNTFLWFLLLLAKCILMHCLQATVMTGFLLSLAVYQ